MYDDLEKKEQGDSLIGQPKDVKKQDTNPKGQPYGAPNNPQFHQQQNSQYNPQFRQQYPPNQGPGYYYPNYGQNQYQRPLPNQPNGLSIAGMVLGIISIPASCCYGFGGVFAIIGLILSLLSKKKGVDTRYSGVAIAGIVTSTIGTIIAACWLVIYILLAINEISISYPEIEGSLTRYLY